MFRTKITLAGFVVAAAITPTALGGDHLYGHAKTLTKAQQSTSFITDTLAPGGTTSVGGRDPWYGYAVSLTQARQSPRFITDTLAPGGGPSVVSAPASNGFDWADAGIGAGAMAGIGALLLGSARLLQRRHVVAV